MKQCAECGMPLNEWDGIKTKHGRFCSYRHANEHAREYAWERYAPVDFEALITLPHPAVPYAA